MLFYKLSGKFGGTIMRIVPAWGPPIEGPCANEANRIGPDLCVWTTGLRDVSCKAWWSYVLDVFHVVCPD